MTAPVESLTSGHHATRAAAAGLAAMLFAACAGTYRPPEAMVSVLQHALSFPEATPECVEILLQRGHVLIQSGTELAGDVQISVRAPSEHSAAVRANSVRLDPSYENGVYTLRVTHAPDTSLDAVDVRYRLRVPANVGIAVLGNTAQVAIRGYAGMAKVRTNSGEILARPAGGDCTLETKSGGIRLGGRFKTAEITTSRGDVAITLPRKRSIDLQASSDSGRVVIDLPEGCRMSLDYTTEQGTLRTDFPVEWEAHGKQGEGNRVYRGKVGDKGCDVTVTAVVRCKQAELEVRRLADPARPAKR